MTVVVRSAVTDQHTKVPCCRWTWYTT